MAVPCAVIGIGQTKYKSRRPDVSLEGLVREAVLRALEDAELTFTPHLLPIPRGLLSTIYLHLNRAMKAEEVVSRSMIDVTIQSKARRKAPFVFVFEPTVTPAMARFHIMRIPF